MIKNTICKLQKMEDIPRMIMTSRKFGKKFQMIVFLSAFFLSMHCHSYAGDVIKNKQGVLAVSLEKRINEPFEIKAYKVILNGKVLLKNLVGDNGLYGATIDDIPAGSHKILVKAVYSGSGYGIFDYHESYSYPVKSESEIEVKEGAITNLKIIFNDNDGFLSELEKRPFISFETGQTSVIVSTDESIVSEKSEEEGPKVKAKHIEKVLVEKGIHQVKVKVVGDGFFEEVSTSRIDKPERIVIDISSVKELLDIDKVVVKSPLLDRVRVGQHPHMSRVVLDIPRNKKVDYEIEKKRDGLIVNVFDSASSQSELIKKDFKGKFLWNLTDVYVEKKDQKIEMFFAGSGDLGAYEGKRFENPDRIVVDIKAASESIQTNKIDVNSSFINSVRIGQHPGGLRLVLDIPEKKEVIYELKKEKAGLLLIVSENKSVLEKPVQKTIATPALASLREISIDKGSVEVEVVLKGSKSFKKYEVKKLEKPDRIVIDIPGVREDVAQDEIEVESSIVKNVRVGFEAGVTRVVIDLVEGMQLGHDVVPSKNGLVISIFKKN